jgi:hypothetical protein
MKALELIYQDTAIQYLVNPNQKNVMINATDMAKVFGKRTKDFLKTDSVKEFISALERALNGARSENKITDNRGHMGIYFDRRLALKFAAWLSPEFEVWVYTQIEEITFGYYKKHWEAHAKQEDAKNQMEQLKEEMIKAPTQENVLAYFEAEKNMKAAKSEKRTAISNQLQLIYQ